MVTSKTKEDCIFCKIVKGEIPADKFYETDNFIVINDIKPVSSGHCLLITKNHYETILDMPSSLSVELIDLVKKQGFRLMKEKKAEGFNFLENVFKGYKLDIVTEKGLSPYIGPYILKEVEYA